MPEFSNPMLGYAKDAVDDLLRGLALADHMGDVCDAVRRFMKATGHPCPYHSDEYDMGECWTCGIEGRWDEEEERFIVSADQTGDV